MKKIFLKSLLGFCILPTPIIGLSSCSKATDLDKLSKTLQQEVVDTFINEVSPIYRETFKTRKIADFIKKFANDNGFQAFEDDYRAAENGAEVSSGNVWFDIPASTGCENWLGLTLQAHMDMVCDLKDKSHEYDWENKGVVAVVENDIIHSKDYATSLGGDDGIGLSTLLCLTKHHNDFKHGKIRMMFTADEEDGDSGASALTTESIANDLIINVDNEALGPITKSCAGTYRLNFAINLSSKWITDRSDNAYIIVIKNLLGDHSAACINEGRANALKVAVDCLKQLDCEPEIISIDCNSANNNIPDTATISFVANKELDISKSEDLINYVKNKYPIEKNVNIYLANSNNSITRSVLPKDESNKVLQLIDNLYFGPYHWFDEPTNTQVSASSNIAPFVLENEGQISFSTLIRSAIKQYENELIDINKKAVNDLYDSSIVQTSTVVTPAWEYEENNSLCDLMMKAFKQDNIDGTIDNSHGWLECAFFKEFRPNAKIISIGPDLTSPHSANGTVKISSIKPLIKSILYCCENINETKK